MIDVMTAKDGGNSLSPYSEYLFNIKINGERCVVEKKGDNIHLYGRSKGHYTKNFPEIVETFKRFDGDFILDGELAIVFNNKHNLPLLLSRTFKNKPIEIKLDSNQHPAIFFAFDIIEDSRNGVVWNSPLKERIEVLKEYQDYTCSQFTTLEYVSYDKSHALLELCSQMGWEGLMAKNPNSIYQFGKRSDDWKKIKLKKEDDVFVLGYTSESREISALITEKGKVNFGVNKTFYDTWSPIIKSLQERDQEEYISYKNSKERGFPINPTKLIAKVQNFGESEEGLMISPVLNNLIIR
jgi:ATP-dependent DNA ligase